MIYENRETGGTTGMKGKSTGGWQPFRSEDDPQIPGQESGNIFSREGLILILLVMIVLIAGGMIYAHFFGPHA